MMQVSATHEPERPIVGVSNTSFSADATYLAEKYNAAIAFGPPASSQSVRSKHLLLMFGAR
jgi:hypothetical protein